MPIHQELSSHHAYPLSLLRKRRREEGSDEQPRVRKGMYIVPMVAPVVSGRMRPAPVIVVPATGHQGCHEPGNSIPLPQQTTPLPTFDAMAAASIAFGAHSKSLPQATLGGASPVNTGSPSEATVRGLIPLPQRRASGPLHKAQSSSPPERAQHPLFPEDALPHVDATVHVTSLSAKQGPPSAPAVATDLMSKGMKISVAASTPGNRLSGAVSRPEQQLMGLEPCDRPWKPQKTAHLQDPSKHGRGAHAAASSLDQHPVLLRRKHSHGSGLPHGLPANKVALGIATQDRPLLHNPLHGNSATWPDAGATMAHRKINSIYSKICYIILCYYHL